MVDRFNRTNLDRHKLFSSTIYIIMPMVWTYLLPPLQNIIWLFPRDEPSIKPTKSARPNFGGNKQHQGSPCGPPDTHNSKYRWITNNRITDWSTSIKQWKCGIRGVKPCRNPERTPRADNDIWEIHGEMGYVFVPPHNPGDYSTHQWWETLKRKRLESKDFNKIKRYSEDTPPWMDP